MDCNRLLQATLENEKYGKIVFEEILDDEKLKQEEVWAHQYKKEKYYSEGDDNIKMLWPNLLGENSLHTNPNIDVVFKGY